MATSSGDIALRIPAALVERLTTAMAEDATKPDGGRVESELQASLYHQPLAWLVFVDAWKDAKPDDKRELLRYLRQYWARVLVSAYTATSAPGGKAIALSRPQVFELKTEDTSKRARRLDALCAYVRVRNRCHSVDVRATIGTDARNVELVFEMLPAQDREPEYQLINIDILDISLTDSLNERLRGKSMAEALDLMKNAATGKKSGSQR